MDPCVRSATRCILQMRCTSKRSGNHVLGILVRPLRATMAEPAAARRVAAVTGGLGGIGEGIVVALTRRGFDVVVCDRKIDPTAAESLEDRAASGARLSFVGGDLADLEDHPRFIEAVSSAFGRIDCLVNNAGVSVMSRGDLLDVSVQSYDVDFAVNTRGAFFLTQAV